VVRGGKGGKDRVVPIHAALARLLHGIPARGPVIVGHHGHRVTPDTVGDIIRRHFAALGIDGTPHQLRHVFGTEAARAAAGDLVTVAALMGHASTSTTMGYNGWTGKGRPVIDSMYGGDAA
jgi:integrase